MIKFLLLMNVKITGHIFRILAELVWRINKYIEQNDQIKFFFLNFHNREVPDNDEVNNYFSILTWVKYFSNITWFYFGITRSISGKYSIILKDNPSEVGSSSSLTKTIQQKEFPYNLLAMIIVWNFNLIEQSWNREIAVTLDRLKLQLN